MGIFSKKIRTFNEGKNYCINLMQERAMELRISHLVDFGFSKNNRQIIEVSYSCQNDLPQFRQLLVDTIFNKTACNLLLVMEVERVVLIDLNKSKVEGYYVTELLEKVKY